MKDTRIYWIWMQQHLPLGDLAIAELLRRFSSAEEVYRASAAVLRETGLSAEKIERLSDKSLERAARTLDAATGGLDFVLTPDDVGYPDRLKSIDGMPLVLYCRGELPDFRFHPAIGVVGTRRATPSGMANAFALGAGLAAGGAIVVSGGALGIDGQAHRGCLSVGGKTILVKPDRLDGTYLREHADLRGEIVRRGGLLVTEFAPDEGGARFDFHIRNRLISGLSEAVCLVETPIRSGSLITARLARDQGRDVFAMPGDVPSHCNDGSHKLIQEGATLVTHATDILQEYTPWYTLDLDEAAAAETAVPDAPPVPSAPPRPRRARTQAAPPPAPADPPVAAPSTPVPCLPEASENAHTVYAALEAVPRHLNDIAGRAGLPVASVLVALTELELCGCAVSAPGGQYCLKMQSL